MSLTSSQQLTALSELLAKRRNIILRDWRIAAHADPEQFTGRSLTISQFLDHIPRILDLFELKLRSRQGGVIDQAADAEKKIEEMKHGLHRWQQGYRLKELINEFGYLQFCLYEELGGIAAEHPEISQETMGEAYRQLLHLFNDTICESAEQYERMQQAEAAGHVGDLMGALADIQEIEQRRTTLFHQAVHDLGNDVMGVSMAASQITQDDMMESDRAKTASFLQRAVKGLNTMLEELMDLARLEAGQENRVIAQFDADVLISELCEGKQPFAKERKLFLEVKGPSGVTVEGDADKVRRVAKNLLINAIKYTESGGVRVSWGEEKENWWLMVKDTGPGMVSDSSTPMVAVLQEATASAKEADEEFAARTGKISKVLDPQEDVASSSISSSTRYQSGEGIGLSIVKRLCELLDASLEISTSSEMGTTFRVVFPRRYRCPVLASNFYASQNS